MMFDRIFPPLHRDGTKFVALAALIALFLIWLTGFFFLPIAAVIWCYYFFRDPVRVVPQTEGLIVSPADGIICSIDTVVPPADLHLSDTPLTKISIFLNVFDCHVNRIPVSGRIERVTYHAGAFLNASLDKASELNERNSVSVRLNDGRLLGVVQIAGLVARRIVCDVAVDDSVQTGQRFGIIRFGSRVDVYLPLGTVPLVAVGQHAIGGETVFADLRGEQPAMQKFLSI